MKNFILLTCSIFILGNDSASSQTTSISISAVNYIGSGMPSADNIFCSSPRKINFYIFGKTSYYPAGSSVTVKANFGDGNDTTFSTAITGSVPGSQDFYSQLTHWYNGTGIFPVEVISIASDMKSDTLRLSKPLIFESPCQTRVFLNSTSFSFFSNCEIPQKRRLYINANTMAYILGDSITFKIAFGDGTDTICKAPVDSGKVNTNVLHWYNSKGNYSTRVIATGPDGKADTLTNLDALILKDTCGNISGKIYQDSNGDCQYNTGDIPLKNTSLVLMENGAWRAWTISNSKGEYWFDVAPGTYTVKIFNGMGASVVCPASGFHTISTFPSLDNNFGFICDTNSGFDLRTYLGGSRFRPGFKGYLSLYPVNNKCEPIPATVKLILDPLLTFKSSYNQTPAVNGDTLIFNYTSISSIQGNSWGNSEYIEVETSTTAVIGDSVCIKVIIKPDAGDIDPANNTITYCFPVRNSWDPNMKEVNALRMDGVGNVHPDNKELNYTIHFQNLGNDTAYNIFILDTLDANLDWSTFRTIGSSHKVEPIFLKENVIKFNFSHIMLPDDKVNEPLSHGSVSYSIRQKPNLPLETKIRNTAHIFFDYNPAVITNTLETKVDTNEIVINSIGERKQKEVRFFPNPAKDLVKLKLSEFERDRTVTLIDLLGKTALVQKAEAQEVLINVSHLPKGIYQLLINTLPSFREKIVIIR